MSQVSLLVRGEPESVRSCLAQSGRLDSSMKRAILEVVVRTWRGTPAAPCWPVTQMEQGDAVVT